MINIDTDLKPCPFCGANGEIKFLENNEYYPVCKGDKKFCLLAREPIPGKDGFLHIVDAISSWNDRSSSIKQNLKPCPFCGEEKIKFYRNGNAHYIYCNTCGACTKNNSINTPQEIIIDQWNKRAQK